MLKEAEEFIVKFLHVSVHTQKQDLRGKKTDYSSSSSNLGTGFTRECIRFRENFAQ